MPNSKTALRIWLAKLDDPDPAVRESSIKALETLGDTDALPALAAVFATDPEPVLRMLAQEAGRAIYFSAIRRTIDAEHAFIDEQQRASEALAQAQSRRAKHKPEE